MSPFEYLARQFQLLVVFCVLVPLLGAWLLYKGFQVARVEDTPLALCAKAFLAGMGIAYLVSMGAAQLLPELAPLARLLVHAGILVGIELLVIVALLRKFTGRALVVQAAAVLLANAAGFGLVFDMAMNTLPVQATRAAATRSPWHN